MAEPVRNLSPDALKQFDWAVRIVRRHFEAGLGEISDSTFLGRRYQEFRRKNDPIYAELLDGMDAEPLAKTFVSYWTIAQTLATRSRFWLEAAVADIIIHQAKHFGRPAVEVYSHAMLGQGFPARRRTIADIGEEELEHLAESSPWHAPIQRSALRTIDILVGEQERYDQPERRLFRPRIWSPEEDRRARERDRDHLAKVAGSLQGSTPERTTLQCNLLVIEPDRHDGGIHAWAVRFVNPKTVAQHAARKQERVNLLRLYALLVQEKIAREPKSISVCIAALVPRQAGWDHLDQYPDYFSRDTCWSSDRLWQEFIKVPFGVVQVAIRAAAKGFRDKLKDGLGHLLPGEDGPQQGLLF